MALVAEYGFEGTGSNVFKDSSGSGNDLTAGALYLGQAPSKWSGGNAIRVTSEGSEDQYAASGTLNASIGSTWTMMAWINLGHFAALPSTRVSYGILGLNGEDSLGVAFLGASGSYSVVGTDSRTGTAAQDNAETLTNDWMHLAVVQNGTVTTLYKNGTAVATGTGTSPTTAPSPWNLFLGAFAGSYGTPVNPATRYYDMDDVRIFDNALSATDVATYMNTPVTSAPAPVTGTLNATTPTITLGVPVASITGTRTVPSSTGALTATTPTITVGVAKATITGTRTVPVRTGALTATSPKIALGVAVATMTGTTTTPTSAGTLNATTPTLTLGVAVADMTGTYTPPTPGAGTLNAATPTITLGVAVASWAGTTTVPVRTGALNATTPTITLGPPTLTLTGTTTTPAATGALVAQAPTITLGPPVLALAGTYTPATGTPLPAPLHLTATGPDLTLTATGPDLTLVATGPALTLEHA